MKTFLVVLAAVTLAACGEQTTQYATYRYTCCPQLTTTTWHPGQHVSLKWATETGPPATDPNPHRVELRASLSGPFPTVDALKQATGNGQTPTDVRTVTGTSAVVDDRNGLAAINDFDLPANLPPGYYNLKTESLQGNLTQSGAAVIVIAP